MLPLSPGVPHSQGENIFSESLIFKWNKVNDAEQYVLFISKKQDDNKFKLIFNSSDELRITDTAILVNTNRLPGPGLYRWNFKAVYKNKSQIYSQRLYFNIPGETGSESFKLISPGTNNFPGTTITDLSPRLSWEALPDAINYQILIYEISNEKDEQIFNSSSLYKINSDYLILHDKYLHFGRNYKWKVIATDTKRGIVSSGEYFFNTNIYKQAEVPLLLKPGLLNEPGENIESIPVVLSWNKSENTRGYAVYISRRTESGEYRDIYNTESTGLIRDTSISVGSDIFDLNGNYRWCIRPYSLAGWGDFSHFVYIQIGEGEIIPGKPLTESPGSLNPDILLNTNPEINFIWNKTARADNYAIYISRQNKSGTFDLIYSSEKQKLITDTSITIGISEYNENDVFRWNMRAYNNAGWSEYSDRRYFRIKNKKTVQSISMSPGSDTSPGTAVNTLQPSLRWSNIEGADNYELLIELIEPGEVFNTIFSTDGKVISQPNFTLPGKLLKNNQYYRWKIRSHSSNGWSGFSDYKYFYTQVVNETETPLPGLENSSDPEEIFLSFKYGGIIDLPLTAYYFNRKLFLPVIELFSSLEINNELNKDEKLISGFFIYEGERYTIDMKNSIATIGAESFTINSESFITDGFDYYFDSDFYSKVFDLVFQIDFRSLTVRTYSKYTLPVYSRIQREKNFNYSKSHKNEDASLAFKREQSIMNVGILDYQASYSVSKISPPYGSYSIGLGGELLYGETEFSTRGFYSDKMFYNDRSDFRWRYVVDDSDYLSAVSIGDINSNGLQPSRFRGISVTNAPTEPRKKFTTIKIVDKTEPNNTVELYINNRLHEIVKADESGKYIFNLPLNYGSTLVELKFYGMNGEYYSVSRLYQTPFSFYQPDEFTYNLNYGKLRITDQKLFNIDAGYGFTENITTKFGVDYIQNFNEDNHVIYNSTSARLFDSYLVNLTVAPGSFYTIASGITYYSQTSIDVEYTRYFSSGFFNPAKYKHELRSNLFLPIRFGYSQLNINASADYSESSVRVKNYILGLSWNTSGFRPFAEYEYSMVNGSGNNFTRETIELGMSYSIYRMPELLGFLKGNLILGRAVFNITDNQFETMSLDYSAGIFSNSRLQLRYSRNFLIEESNLHAQLVIYFPAVQYSASATSNYFSQNILGSIGYVRETGEITAFNRNQIGKSSAIFRLFVDDNGNGLFDDDEIMIKDGGISLGTSILEKSESGEIKARELNPYTVYTARINEESIKNPLLVPKYKQFAFKTGAEPFKIIDIPFYIAGEISGSVFESVNNTKIFLPGIKLTITNIESNERINTSTYTNGSFYHFGLKPGMYRITLDKVQLEALKLRTKRNDIIFEILPDGGIDSSDEVEIRLVK
ncbi:MAG: carboxypeptidase regulatory-like domain-containing protein [Melioribacteraceae bacterium]|nr:carboxypeptidase regulatory-like domain-containing protein [Melioribacteraceae bacterium]